MAFGLEIYNGSGKLQLGTSSRQLRFHSIYTFTRSSWPVSQTVTGMINDGTWVAIPSSTSDAFIVTLNNGGFSVNHPYVGTFTVSVLVFRM